MDRLSAGRSVLFLSLLTVGSAWSQEARGTILGRVTDSQNAVVRNPAIQILNVATGSATSVKSNEQGNFEVPFLLLGTYTITAEAPGFKKTIRSGIEVRVGDKLELNLVLEIGALTESVNVNAETPLLDTATASMGSVIAIGDQEHPGHRKDPRAIPRRSSKRDESRDLRQIQTLRPPVPPFGTINTIRGYQRRIQLGIKAIF